VVDVRKYINSEMQSISIKIQHLRQKKARLLREIQETEVELQKLQDKLEDICEHEWVVDRSQYDHHTCYECAKCGACR